MGMKRFKVGNIYTNPLGDILCLTYVDQFIVKYYMLALPDVEREGSSRWAIHNVRNLDGTLIYGTRETEISGW